MTSHDPLTSPTAHAGVTAELDFAPLPELPSELGGHRVLRPIARGGMAEVYEVAEPKTGERLALKLLMAPGVSMQRFNREYEAMSRLNHPNIVRVYNYGVHLGHPYITMELICGVPVQAYAKRLGRPGTPRRTEEVIRLTHDLSLALDHIHRRELLHRDLKSANVLVLPDGRVKLIDFGTAKVADPYEEITEEGEFIGTFAYASPEQIRGKNYDGRSDLYSLGVLLYRMCTGRRPFPGDDARQLVQAHLTQEPLPPRRLVGSLPRELEAVILALLEKRPENRPSSGAEVAAALEAVAGHPLLPPGTLDVDQSASRVVGREAQVSLLWEYIDGRREDDPPIAIALGLEGSGRSRLLRALVPYVAERGGVVAWLTFEDGVSPILPWTRLLERIASAVPEPRPKSVERALRLGARLTRSTGLALNERLEGMAQAIVEVLLQRPEHELMVLLVEGLEHAGEAGIAMLQLLREATTRAGVSLRVVAACHARADAPRTYLRKQLTDALRIELPPLEAREVGLLVGALLHRRPPPAAVVRRIHQATGGLPSYVEELVNTLVDQGLLEIRGQNASRIEWARRLDIEMPVPPRAEDAVVDDLARLPADRRRLLEALALAGGEARLEVLAYTIEHRPAQLGPAISELVASGWIRAVRVRGQRLIRWSHLLAEKVVLSQMSPCRRRTLERLLLEKVKADPPFEAQIHLLLANDQEADAMNRTVDWALHQLGRHRPLTALRALDAVMERVESSPVGSQLKAQLHLLHVTAMLRARPADTRTGRSLARASKHGSGLGVGFEAELALTRATTQQVIGHYPNFRKYLQLAWEHAEHLGENALAASVANQLAWSERIAGNVEAAAAWHGKARRIATSLQSPLAIALADTGVAAWQYARGLIVEAERTARAAIVVFDEAGDALGLSEALPVWAHALRQQGRFSEALTVLYTQLPRLQTSEVATFYLRLLLATAWLELDLCRLGRAQELVDELQATLRQGEHLDLRLEADLLWGQILLASGEYMDAERLLSDVQSRAKAAGLQVLEAWSAALRGELRAAIGDPRAARVFLKPALEMLAETGDVPATAAACCAAARALASEDPPEVLFAPVAHFLERQPAVMLSVEVAVAGIRYTTATGGNPLIYRGRAVELIHAIAERLDDTDRAALHLHPHSRRTRAFSS